MQTCAKAKQVHTKFVPLFWFRLNCTLIVSEINKNVRFSSLRLMKFNIIKTNSGLTPGSRSVPKHGSFFPGPFTTLHPSLIKIGLELTNKPTHLDENLAEVKRFKIQIILPKLQIQTKLTGLYTCWKLVDVHTPASSYQLAGKSSFRTSCYAQFAVGAQIFRLFFLSACSSNSTHRYQQLLYVGQQGVCPT